MFRPDNPPPMGIISGWSFHIFESIEGKFDRVAVLYESLPVLPRVGEFMIFPHKDIVRRHVNAEVLAVTHDTIHRTYNILVRSELS